VTSIQGELPAGTRLDELEIREVIGRGGFAIVYLCEDRALKRRVAVKEYMPQLLATRTSGSQVVPTTQAHSENFETGRRSFLNEAQLLAQLNLPLLPTVYRLWEANGTAYMMMPYYEGRTLEHFRRETPALIDERFLIRLVGPLLEVLEVLHRKQIFHRDISPDNILIQNNDLPLLLDLGAAREVAEDDTRFPTAILKKSYAPYEQGPDGHHMKQGPWTDIFALGAVLHFAITGKPPFPSYDRVGNPEDPYKPLAKFGDYGRYSHRFLSAVDRALVLRPGDRPQTIAEFRRMLGIGAIQSNPGKVASCVRPAVYRLAILALVIAAIAALAITAYTLSANMPPSPIHNRSDPQSDRTDVTPEAAQQPSAPKPSPEDAPFDEESLRRALVGDHVTK
jgi:serine/threonine protein kinase